MKDFVFMRLPYVVYLKNSPLEKLHLNNWSRMSVSFRGSLSSGYIPRKLERFHASWRSAKKMEGSGAMRRGVGNVNVIAGV
jgi:hypothetical protein